MTALDFSLGTSRTPLDIQPGIANYFNGRQDKRLQRVSDAAVKDEEKQKTIADYVVKSMTPEGELDRKSLAAKLLNRGWIEDHNKINADLTKQDKDIATAKADKDDRDGKQMGAYADFYLGSTDKESAYQTILGDMVNNKIEAPPHWGLQADPNIDRDMDLISTRWGKKSEPVKTGTQPKPDFVKGENGNFWVASPDGTMKDTGTQFYKDPEAPESYQTVVTDKGIIQVGSKSGKTRSVNQPGTSEPVVPPPKPADAKGLSGDAAKVLTIADTMIPEARELQEMYRANPKSTLASIKSGVGLAARKAGQVADKLGRLRSGGAVNKDEEARFMGQIAKLSDLATGPEGAINSLESIIKEAEGVKKAMSGKQDSASPKDGETKTNADGDKIVYRGGKWQLAE